MMKILEAYDLTCCAHSAAQLVGCDEKTVTRYVTLRDAGGDPADRPRRPRMIDPFLDKIEELVDKSAGKVRADVVHEKLEAMGFTGTSRTTRRTVAEAKAEYRAGHRRKYRPWLPAPGMWLQFDWGEGPKVDGRRTQLFCAWLSWSRFRVVIPSWDQQLPTLVACVDQVLRFIGRAPTYLLTDNPRTVTMDRIAGLPVRHPDIVAAGAHYGCVVHTCEPFDPESKGGAEHTVKIAKADLVPTSANLRSDYATFGELVEACEEWCEKVNGRPHRATGVPPVDRLAFEWEHLHPLPAEPHQLALGDERVVDNDQTIRYGSVRYSTPDGHQGSKVWCRVSGNELVIAARTDGQGVREITRHELSTPGHPRIRDEHYPHHPSGEIIHMPKPHPSSEEEIAFCTLGDGAHAWLVAAAAAGVTRIRAKMARAVELARVMGGAEVDAALAVAAAAGRFGYGDLASILEHRARRGGADGPVAVVDEQYSAQPGTGAWKQVGA